MTAIDKLLEAYNNQMKYSTHVIAFIAEKNNSVYVYTSGGLETLDLDGEELKKYESVTYCEFFNTEDNTPKNIKNMIT